MFFDGASTVLGAATTQINGRPNQYMYRRREGRSCRGRCLSLISSHLLIALHTENVVDPIRINPVGSTCQLSRIEFHKEGSFDIAESYWVTGFGHAEQST